MTWPQDALHDLEHTDLSLETIGKKYGRSRSAVVQLCNQHNIKRPPVQRGMKPIQNAFPISVNHYALGMRLTLYRGERSYIDLAEELGVSRHVARTMELGLHDFTLSQLLKLSNIMGQDLGKIVETQNGR